MVDQHPPLKTPVPVYCPGHAGADRPAGKATLTSGLLLGRSEVLRSLRTLAAGTKPRTSHHRSAGGERRGKRKRQTIFLERTREGHRQSDENWNRFKGDFGETSERRGGAPKGFPSA